MLVSFKGSVSPKNASTSTKLASKNWKTGYLPHESKNRNSFDFFPNDIQVLKRMKLLFLMIKLVLLNLISLSPRIVSLLSFAGLAIDGKDTYFVHDSIVLYWSGLGERKFHDC